MQFSPKFLKYLFIGSTVVWTQGLYWVQANTLPLKPYTPVLGLHLFAINNILETTGKTWMVPKDERIMLISWFWWLDCGYMRLSFLKEVEKY
jgi:hypothetical protein